MREAVVVEWWDRRYVVADKHPMSYHEAEVQACAMTRTLGGKYMPMYIDTMASKGIRF